jgi:hypothetical protein
LPFAAELGDQELEDFAGILWMEHWHLPDPLAERAVARVPRAAPLRPSAAPIQDATGGGQLDLADDAGGPRHFLQGRALDAGDAIELLTAEGRWIFGHYDNQRFGDYLDPLFHFDLACAGAAPDWAAPRCLAVSLAHTRVSLPPDATLRWPPR